MRKTELKNCPQWLLDARTENEDVDIAPDGLVVWLDGDWHGGDWIGGVWHDGFWHTGVWLDGDWHTGVWRDGVWHGGDWHGGDWHTGVWHGGVWHGGDWHGGDWIGGVWHGPENRLLYMAALLGIVFDAKTGRAVAYRTTSANNHGRYYEDFVQTSGRVDVEHEPAGNGTCCAGIHATTAARAYNYVGVDPTAKLWRVEFEQGDLLDCDGEKIRLRGGWCEEIPWPFLTRENP